MNENKKRKLLRAACHASALTGFMLAPLSVPIIILFVSDDPLVRDSAKESINFVISLLIQAVISFGLFCTLIGSPIAIVWWIVLGIAEFILPIVAIVSVLADPEKRYRYPMTIRLLKHTELAPPENPANAG